MKWAGAILTMLAALLAVAPAHAATSIDCAIDKLSPEMRDAWGQSLLRAMRGSRDETDLDSGYRAVRSCARDLKWSDAAVRAVIGYIGVQAALPIQRDVVKAAGYDIATLDAAIADIPPEMRRDFTVSPVSVAASEAVVRALRSHGIAASVNVVPPGMKTVIGYIMLRCLVERNVADFAKA